MRNRTPDSSRRSYDELQSENTQALLDRLEAEVAKEEIADMALIEAILEILDERAPLDIPRDTPEESLKKFRAKFAPILDSDVEERTEPRRPVRHGVARVAIAACLCVVMLIAVAQACGLDLIGRFLEWGEETFILHGANYDGGQMALEEAPEGEFTSMEDAVAAYGITDPVVPTWIPEGFSVQYVKAKEQTHAVSLTARYLAGDKEIVLKVYSYRGTGEYEIHSEHTDPQATEYEANGTTFLLSSNEGQYQASWLAGGCTCNINGDLTEDEIKKMVDSIQP